MADAIEFRLNGEPVRVEAVSPNLTLLEWLRASGRTGSKEGCAEGDCGACSVAIVDRDAHGEPCYRAINSCLVPLPLMADCEIVTVEGVRCGKLHPVQSAMVENFGSQCGYCTPGFIMSLFEGYHRRDLTTAAQLQEQLCGNLCRCTGYRAIENAASEAFAKRSEAARPTAAMPELRELRYTAGAECFARPASLRSLFELLAANPDARLIAGATELGLNITKRYEKFPLLVALDAVPELHAITSSDAEWSIGAACNLTQIEDRLAEEFPALGEMLRVFGSRQIRNRATLGGNLVTASPIGDNAPVLLTLDARVVLASAAGERTLPLDEFFISYRKTALQTGEILKAILLPRGDRAMRRYYKVSRRREMDISTVAGCFAIDLDGEKVARARIAYGGVALTPSRARKTEQALTGKQWNAETVAEVLPVLAKEFTPISDVRGSAAYRQGMITSLFEKFFHEGRMSGGRSSRDAAGEPRGARPASQEFRPPDEPEIQPPPKGVFQPHESAHKHVTGEAIYVDDGTAGMLETWPVCAPHARAKILRRDVSVARTMPGISAVLLAEDVPGLNDVGAVRHDEILLADKEAFYHGQIIALVVGTTPEACRAAAAKVIVEYEPMAPILGPEEAIAQESFHTDANFIRRGDCAGALATAPLSIEGEFSLGGQDHFYLETQAAWAERGEDGTIFVSSSTQHPSEVQHIVAHVLALPMHSVVIQCPRMGGGFGGKETQAATLSALAALAATKTGRPARVRFNRDQDMMITGKRHPFYSKFRVGFDHEGRVQAAKVELFSNGGWTLDLSGAVTDRAVFHLDNAYYIPHAEFSGRVTKTNLASNTAFRGFGGPQGMLVMEEILDRIARQLGLAPEVVRERNLYHGRGETNTTHYGQEIEDNRIQSVWRELKETSGFAGRREEIARWNSAHPDRKRGLAITPVKFGISFTTTHLNQAGALVLLYQDGTAQVNHGGAEMGQGVHTNMAMIAAKELGLTFDKVRVMPTQTDKVPNTSATAASCGTDLNGAAVKNACDILRERLLPFAVAMLEEKNGQPPTEGVIRFAENSFSDAARPDNALPFSALVQRAYFARTSLSTTGYYKTPEIHYDRAAGRGKPFHYFAIGAAVSEVEVDGFTGMTQVTRVDILHDCGDAINEGITRGQIEGGFVQGMGWLTVEELVSDAQGRLLTHSPDTYKIPAIGDVPRIFNVAFLSAATQANVIHGSKAVGEPPLMLAMSVREAIRDAVAAFGEAGGQVPLASPATAEAIFMAIQNRRSPA